MKVKYVVFKAEDYDRIVQQLSNAEKDSALLADYAITDAWVVRPNDIHAPSVLHAYANAVQATIELLRAHAPTNPNTDMTLDHLHSIRDAAFEHALSADAASHRLPD